MLIKGGKIVTSEQIEKEDIRIKGEKIVEVGRGLSPAAGEEVIDAGGKYIFPGIIDAHTHFKLQARGTVTADDFYWGGRSAAFGGVTTVIDYADQEKDSLLAGLEKRKKEAADSVIDYSFHLVLNNNFSPQKHIGEFSNLIDEGISSLKIFTTYQDIYMLARDKLISLFNAVKETGLLITVHAEDDDIINEREEEYRARAMLGIHYHPEIRPGRAEGEAVKKLTDLAEKIGIPIYIVHLSAEEGYRAALEARKQNCRVYLETAPHYLLLDRHLLSCSNSQLNLMTPPLRRKKDNEILWEGIGNGSIDVIATDHCAFSIEQKMEGKNSLDTLPGIPGVETLLPLIYTSGVRAGKISLKRMVELLSVNPAQIFGLYPEKGSIEEGTDADLVIFNPDIRWELKGEVLHSRADYTPFAGREVYGKPTTTILRGQKIVERDIFTGKKGYGRFVRAGKK